MTDPLQQFKEVLKNIRLSDTEKSAIRARILQYMMNPRSVRAIPSPYLHPRFMVKPLQVLALSLVIVLGTGGGVAFAAQKALPGEALYGIKVHVNEELAALMKRGPEAKAEHAIVRAEERLDETTTLVLSGKLDESTRDTISKHLAKHTSDMKKFSDDIEDEQPQIALGLTSSLESSLTSRIEILEEIKDDTNEDKELVTLLAVADESVARVHQDKKDAEERVNEIGTVTEQDRVVAKMDEIVLQLGKINVLLAKESLVETNETFLVTETKETLIKNTILEETSETFSKEVALSPEKITLGDKKTAIEALVTDAKVKIEAGNYSEALVLLEQAKSQASSILTVQDLKETFDLVDDSSN